MERELWGYTRLVTNRKRRVTRYLNSSALTAPLMAFGAASAFMGPASAQTLDAGALPQNPNVAGGAATFAQSGKTLTVTQSTNRTVIDWRSFNIGADAQANFNQPNSGSIAVNRVNASADPSRIEGGLSANGQVWILNPNGVLFGKTAHVDAAGIVASTANIDTARFMAGDNRLNLTGADKGSVVNDGSITVGKNGLAAFVAPSVRNSGTITARVGKVALAAGTTFTLDLAGDQLVEIGLGSGKAVVDQSGKIVNAGGTVTLTARAAGQVVDSVVNMSGVTRTASARKVGGDIVLDGDTVNVSGTADASGTTGGNIAITGKTINVASNAALRSDAGSTGDGGTIKAVAADQGNYAGSYSAKGGSASGNGGKIETSGEAVSVAADAKIDASAANGNAGTWLLDPLNVTISTGTDNMSLTGATVTTGTIHGALARGTSVDITTNQNGTDNGDLTLAGSITATSTGNAGLTLEGRHLSATGGSIINISNGALTLDVNTVNNTTSVSGSWISDAIAMIGTVSGGSTVNVGPGTYNENLTISKAGLTLLSTNGSASTIINGQGSSALGAVLVKANANNFTLGSIGHGFTILGIDNASPGVESAAVYFQGANSGSRIVGNEITARGDYGLLSEVNGVGNLTIDSNIFDGKTFAGATAGDSGFNNQFTAANVPRQLVVVNGGAAVSNITFTNNSVTGTAGALNASGQEQGNTLVTIDAIGATITGNIFAGTTTRFGAQLRTRGTGTIISGNSFDSTNIGQNAGVIEFNSSIFTGLTGGAPSNLTAVMAANTFTNRAVWDANAAVGSTDYVVGVNIANAIASASAGDTINVNNGTYVVPSSTPYLNVTKSLSLIGQSQAGTIIDARNANTYGLRISSPNSNVTLQNFTLYGVTSGTSQYGLKAENVTNLTLRNITSQGAGKSEFDLNGILGATLDNLTANGASVATGLPTPGNGIAITDSQNITLTNSTTMNNAWGGLALYQSNFAAGGYPYQEKNITVDGTNNFTESNPIYAEDASAGVNSPKPSLLGGT